MVWIVDDWLFWIFGGADGRVGVRLYVLVKGLDKLVLFDLVRVVVWGRILLEGDANDTGPMVVMTIGPAVDITALWKFD